MRGPFGFVHGALRRGCVYGVCVDVGVGVCRVSFCTCTVATVWTLGRGGICRHIGFLDEDYEFPRWTSGLYGLCGILVCIVGVCDMASRTSAGRSLSCGGKPFVEHVGKDNRTHLWRIGMSYRAHIGRATRRPSLGHGGFGGVHIACWCVTTLNGMGAVWLSGLPVHDVQSLCLTGKHYIGFHWECGCALNGLSRSGGLCMVLPGFGGEGVCLVTGEI